MKSSAALDVRAWYAELLQQWGERDDARAIAEDALRHVNRMSSHAKQINDPWIRRLRQVLSQHASR